MNDNLIEYNKILKELAICQDKLKTINTLTNCTHKLDNINDLEEISYLIHQIVELDGYVDSNIARQVMCWSIKANNEMFVQV